MILLITAVLMLQGSGVAGGASIVVFITDQVEVTVCCGVGANTSLRTTTSLLQFSLYILYWDTATFRAGIGGIITKVSTVLVGVITACGAPLSLVMVKTVHRFVGR